MLVLDRARAVQLDTQTSRTVAGIGTGFEYRYFHTLGFESGASGTFAGLLTGLTGDSITGFACGDGLYVNGFTAASTIATIGAGGTLAIVGTCGNLMR